MLTVRYKISWSKVLDLVAVMLGNMFRLRELWGLCHPGFPMKLLSLDEKPSYVNNCGKLPTYVRKGATKVEVAENHAAAHARYTILTSVPSWQQPGQPCPYIAILFKAKSGASILKKLQVPDWIYDISWPS